MTDENETLGFASGRVAKNAKVRIVVKRGAVKAEWWPVIPRRLNARQLARYRRIRADAMAMAAERLGGTVAVLEPGANDGPPLLSY